MGAPDELQLSIGAPALAEGDVIADADAEPDAAEPERRHVIVSGAFHAQRLDKVLAAAAPEFSRNHLQGLVEAGHVQVDGVACTHNARKMRQGQAVDVVLVPTAESQAFRPEPMSLQVLYEDEHVLVIDKPAGLVVHPAAGHWSGTLLNGLLARHAPASRLPRAGIVHRLDKDTSGVMVVGKTLEAVTGLVRDIAARVVQRQYLALAWGDVQPDEQRVDAPIGRDPAQRTRMAGGGFGPHGTDRRHLPGPPRRLQRPAVPAAHRAHAPDPCAPGLAQASAGGRRRVRRPARAGPDATGAARHAAGLRAPGDTKGPVDRLCAADRLRAGVGAGDAGLNAARAPRRGPAPWRRLQLLPR